MTVTFPTLCLSFLTDNSHVTILHTMKGSNDKGRITLYLPEQAVGRLSCFKILGWRVLVIHKRLLPCTVCCHLPQCKVGVQTTTDLIVEMTAPGAGKRKIRPKA